MISVVYTFCTARCRIIPDESRSCPAPDTPPTPHTPSPRIDTYGRWHPRVRWRRRSSALATLQRRLINLDAFQRCGDARCSSRSGSGESQPAWAEDPHFLLSDPAHVSKMIPYVSPIPGQSHNICKSCWKIFQLQSHYIALWSTLCQMGTFASIFRRLDRKLTRPCCQSPIDCVFKWSSFHQFPQTNQLPPASSDGC